MYTQRHTNQHKSVDMWEVYDDIEWNASIKNASKYIIMQKIK